MRVRIYKRIFEKKDTDRPSFGEADVFSSWLDLPLGSVRRKNPKGEKRKNNGSFIISRSAVRKSAPLRSIPFLHFPFVPGGLDLVAIFSRIYVETDTSLSNQTFKNSTEEHYHVERRVKVQVYAYSNVLKSLK